MGVRQIYLEYLENRGVLDRPGTNVLDIGAQNAYLFEKQYVNDFLMRRGVDTHGMDDVVQKFVDGGAFDPSANGFHNNSFLNDLFRIANIKYTSLDVFERPDNIIVDLNEFVVPPQMLGAYNVVLNFGTTEHVFDQRNCFEVIHQCTAVDGFIFHQVPSVGCVDHSFFVYSPVFFASMAAVNEYEMIDLWFSGPYGSNRIFDTLKNHLYSELMPHKDTLRDANLPDNIVSGWNATPFPDGTINVLLRKNRDLPFRIPFELSTAIGAMALEENGMSGRRRQSIEKFPNSVLWKELYRRFISTLRLKVGQSSR